MFRKIIMQMMGFFLAWATVSAFCFDEDSGLGLYEVDKKLEKLQIYFETEMYEEASLLLDGLIAQFPDESRFKYLRAIVDYERQDYDRAQNVFVKFIQEYPQVPEPYYLLGEINLKKGNIDEAKQYLARYCELVPEDNQAQQKLSSFLNNSNPDSIVIMKDGKEDGQLVKKIGFYGGCVPTPQDDALKLVNGSFCTWSSLGIDFAYPLDLRGKNILLKLKGKCGQERFMLTFRDNFAQDYTPQLEIITKEEALSPDWQQIKITLDENCPKIDLSSVVHMGIEFGFATVRNPANSTIYVKDILIEP